jgi:hypothetical protein
MAAGILLAGVACSKDTTTTTSATTVVEASSGTKAPGTTERAPGTTRKGTTETTTGSGDETTTTEAGGTGTGSGTDPDGEFCTQIKRANDEQKSTDANGIPTKAQVEKFLGYLEAARDAAPEDAIAPLDTLTTAYREFEKALDGPNPEEAAFSILATNTNLAAITALSTVVKSTCGFALPGAEVGSGSGSGSGSGTGTGTATGGGDGFDCSSIKGFNDDDEPEDPTSIAAAKRAICETRGTEAWFKLLANRASWSVSGSTEPTWEIAVYQDEGDAEFTADNALEVCGLLSTYLASVGVDGPEISIGLTHESAGDLTPKTVLATKATSAPATGAHAGCEPA